ncbi:hypothetical protein CHARACLAT_015262 [Characodon lateralis]|uniref:Uncharacterized protein n=1 Tax=Characodon lateralis TaxID=208331 RepID=A0ABU7DSU5_9TELE|nr:hypothetical protein [Characodon lateralis]
MCLTPPFYIHSFFHHLSFDFSDYHLPSPHLVLLHNFIRFTQGFHVPSVSPHRSFSLRSSFPLFSFHCRTMTLESSPPATLKDGTARELSVNAAWGTGLVHALLHKRDFWCMINTADDARLGMLTLSQKPLGCWFNSYSYLGCLMTAV